MREYNLVVSSGTFDYFHEGHKAFLRFALTLSEKVLIGITSDTFVAKNKQASHVGPFDERQRTVVAFLREAGFSDRATILPIDTVFIPKQWEQLQIEAIVATDDSVHGASLVNEDRKKRGLSTLPIKLFHLAQSEDGLPISATRIREGLIDREGKLSISPDWFSQTFALPESLRLQLKEPIGEIIWFETYDFSAISMDHVATVGDVTAKLFHDHGFFSRVSIVDFMVKREKRYSSFEELGFTGEEIVYTVVNPPGQITSDLLRTVTEVFETIHQQDLHSIIRVVGEEDLAVLPVVLAAPLGFRVFYGQPGVGTVEVIVTEEIKQHLKGILLRFQKA